MNHPAPPSPPSEHGYRQQLNNWMQSRGLRDRLTWGAWNEVSGDRPIWFAVYKFDDSVYGQGSGNTLAIAKEQAARIAYRCLLWEAVERLIQRRSTQAAS